MSEKASASKRIVKGRISYPSTISQALSQIDLLQNHLLRNSLMMLSGLAFIISIVGFVEFDPMNGSAMLSIASSLLIFYVLLYRLPETFRTLWNRNIICAKSSAVTFNKILNNDIPNTEGAYIIPSNVSLRISYF